MALARKYTATLRVARASALFFFFLFLSIVIKDLKSFKVVKDQNQSNQKVVKFFKVKIKAIKEFWKEIYQNYRLYKKTAKNNLKRRLKVFSKEKKIFALCYLVFMSIQ